MGENRFHETRSAVKELLLTPPLQLQLGKPDNIDGDDLLDIIIPGRS